MVSADDKSPDELFDEALAYVRSAIEKLGGPEPPPKRPKLTLLKGGENA